MDWEEMLEAEGVFACACCQMLSRYLDKEGFCSKDDCQESKKEYYGNQTSN